MKKGLFIILISCFSLTIISCGEDKEESTTDTRAPVIAEVTAVTTPTSTSTPNYTFSSDEAGTITYGGSCSSSTTSATTGNNTVTLVSLSDATYSDCTITVTDAKGNVSNTLEITSFTVEAYAPTVSSISPTENQSVVSITDNISVTFSEAMDTTSVTTNTSNSTCSGTLRVSSDNFSTCVKMSSSPASSNSDKTFTLDPADNLSNSTTYKIRVTTGVKDSAGNAMSSQYETSNGFITTSIYNKTNGDNHGSTGKMDYNGYTYNVVRIDDRWWTAENLRTTTYNDGTSLTKWISGSSSGVYSDSDNITKYGYLYAGYAAKSDNLAPSGWHVANYWDFIYLQHDVDSTTWGGNCSSCALKLLATGEGGTNDVGFSALLGGLRLSGGDYTWGGGPGYLVGFHADQGSSSGTGFTIALASSAIGEGTGFSVVNGQLFIRLVED